MAALISVPPITKRYVARSGSRELTGVPTKDSEGGKAFGGHFIVRFISKLRQRKRPVSLRWHVCRLTCSRVGLGRLNVRAACLSMTVSGNDQPNQDLPDPLSTWPPMRS